MFASLTRFLLPRIRRSVTAEIFVSEANFPSRHREQHRATDGQHRGEREFNLEVVNPSNKCLAPDDVMTREPHSCHLAGDHLPGLGSRYVAIPIVDRIKHVIPPATLVR